jgi:hypothetical protein
VLLPKRVQTNQSGIVVDRVRARGMVGNSGESLDRSCWPCAGESGVPAGPFGGKTLSQTVASS